MDTARAYLVGSALLLLAAIIFGISVWYSENSSNSLPQPPPTVSVPVGYVGGTVTAVGQDSLTVNAKGTGAEFGKELGRMTFMVGPQTEIYKMGAPKDPAIFTQEAAIFQAQEPDATVPLFSPDPYEHEPVQLTELVGLDVSIAFEETDAGPRAWRIQLVQKAPTTETQP